MSSSYSPDLRIELIGTGDQAGVWGSTTNNNLGTFIENAVAGYTSVSIIASPQALTANDGAADEARFATIALTTVTGANFTVCIPPNSKLYTFYNASSYTARISNSTVKNGITLSGGTTVDIPTGKTISVWSDGTNVSVQNNHLTSLTLATALPVASGGTGVTTAAAITALVGNLLFPVGSIYTNAAVATNPATLLGFGTWVAAGAGRVMIGVGTNGGQTFANGASGGTYAPPLLAHVHAGSTGNNSADHSHGFSGTTGGQSADHNHGLNGQTIQGGSNTSPSALTDFNTRPLSNVTQATSNDHNHSFSGTTAGQSVNHTHAFTTDAASNGDQTTGNMQPYVAVYMWQRTA